MESSTKKSVKIIKKRRCLKELWALYEKHSILGTIKQICFLGNKTRQCRIKYTGVLFSGERIMIRSNLNTLSLNYAFLILIKFKAGTSSLAW